MCFLDICAFWSLSDFASETELGEWTWTHAVERLKNFCVNPVLHDDNFFKSFVVHDSKSVDNRKDRKDECCDHSSWNQVV